MSARPLLTVPSAPRRRVTNQLDDPDPPASNLIRRPFEPEVQHVLQHEIDVIKRMLLSGRFRSDW